MTVIGYDAMGFGIAIISVALFLHAHDFWSPSPRWWASAELLKVLSLIAGLLGIGFVIVRSFTLI